MSRGDAWPTAGRRTVADDDRWPPSYFDGELIARVFSLSILHFSRNEGPFTSGVLLILPTQGPTPSSCALQKEGQSACLTATARPKKADRTKKADRRPQLASKSFMKNSLSCPGWKCKRMDLAPTDGRTDRHRRHRGAGDPGRERVGSSTRSGWRGWTDQGNRSFGS